MKITWHNLRAEGFLPVFIEHHANLEGSIKYAITHFASNWHQEIMIIEFQSQKYVAWIFAFRYKTVIQVSQSEIKACTNIEAKIPRC